ncbi:Septation protein imp2 [Pseudocercospora fuligena]|uniref:Septation protein imp2 n=1 Tax=Pseudocercospora fuligena TaxID=685502 RepID=A0A8H6REP7_9PEZI|nr:Septation protein imp2 [Pseudocercospora fuligena]
MPGRANGSDGPSVSLSFANNFWGKDDAGVGPLLDRMHSAKVTGNELKDFYHARAALEDDYAKKLLSLARKPLGSSEAGTLRMSLDVVRGEVESMGKAHQHIAQQMRGELEEPLTAFTGGINERRKIVQNGIEKLLKTKNQQTAVVNKTRDRFEQDCLKIKGYLAQGHMVMGQEERKNKAKLEKTQIQMSSNSSEYEAAVKILEETTGRWNREWKAACDKFQDLEEERLDYFKSSLWSFANIASTVCVSDDQSCEKIRLSLEDCEVEKDISTFIKVSGTGQEIPDPPKYINFCRGDIDDVVSNHESDDGNYSVAQFQRTLNPTYRTSSPQPSTFESHHDPDSSLREEMGIPKNRTTSIQADESFTSQARSSHGSATGAMPPPLAGSAVSSAPSNPYSDAPQIPHNPYPTDGMTQFCRIGPPSERSSVPSPVRPGSRDSMEHSDYSAPTSFSSMEPTSGAASPTKGYNGSNISGVSSMSGVSSGPDEKTIQKKKSGFFNSPFKRRASTKRKEEPQSATATPTGRNTWTPATMRKAESANTSPVKPFGTAGRASTWNKQPSVSPDPDVDPRADYQLGIGNSTFEVTHPTKKQTSKSLAGDELDPIAQALAELKGVTKQASNRESADRHYGMSTPAPGVPTGRSTPAGAVPTPFASNGNRGTPPPAYDPPVSRLGAPPPAHTKREMQKTAEQYVSQKRNMFNTGGPSRPGSSMGRQEPPRAASPQPPRATSPRPLHNGGQPAYRAASPNPYGSAPSAAARPRAQSSSPVKPQPNYGGYAPRGGSPGYQVPRATSPNPAYSRPATSGGMANSRPPSSRGSDTAGGAMVLAPAGGDPYGSQRGGRPQSQYYPEGSGYGNNQLSARVRSQSQGTQRQVTKDGRPILHYARAMYMYQAAIPEELSFAKGDILAVTRHQDDGWWEAEVTGKPGVLGLVPSNYLKAC